MNQNQKRKCLCDVSLCGKCLAGNCEDDKCLIHTKERKEAYKNGQKFYIVPQTEEEIERNRKAIELLREKGLLEKYEKTFQILDDGTVIEDK